MMFWAIPSGNESLRVCGRISFAPRALREGCGECLRSRESPTAFWGRWFPARLITACTTRTVTRQRCLWLAFMVIDRWLTTCCSTMRGMAPGPDDTVAFRLWPPVAIGVPLLAGWVVTQRWGDPVDLGGWRVPLGWLLVVLFAVWNAWSLWLFGRHETGLLPGQATSAMIEEGPYRLSRNPLYVGLLALYLGWRCWQPRSGGSCCSQSRCCSCSGVRSSPRSGSCASGSVRRTTTTRGGCVAGCEPSVMHVLEDDVAKHHAVDRRDDPGRPSHGP